MADIKTILKQRLESGAAELSALQSSLAQREHVIIDALKEIPKGFRGSRTEYEAMDDNLKKLEFAHSTRNNMTNAQEREMLKEMEKNRKRKKELAAFLVLDDEVKAAKQLRDDERKRFDAAESVQRELSGALRKMEMADRLGCKALDLIDKVVPVPEEARGRLVGRGGSNIKAVEKDCDVTIELDRKGGKTVAKVCGLMEGVTEAVARLEEVTLSIVVDLDLASPFLVLLLAKRAALSNKLQQEHSVKIDIFMEGGRRSAEGAGSRVAVTGRPDDVESACSAIKGMKAVSKVMSLPAKVRPAVIGKAGNNVIAMEKQYNVIIDSSKDETSDKVTVTGSSQGVAAAITALTAQISAQEPVVLEITLSVPFISQVLLADRGSRLRSLQSETGVALTLEKDKGECGVLGIAGPRGSSTKAKDTLDKFIASLLKKTLLIPLGSSSIGSVVGKGGSNIRDMRAPGVVVEVDEDQVRVFAEDDQVAQSTADKVRELVDKNQRLEVPLSSTLSRQLFGMPGRVIRKAIMDLDDSQDLTMERDRSSGAANLRGKSDYLKSASLLIQSFVKSHVEVTIELLCPEDERALVGGGEDCALRLIQQMCHVDLTLGKQKGSKCVTVAGQESNVAEAERRIRGELDGSPDGTVVVIMVDEDAIGSVIGKKGANAKRIESLFNVKFDSVQSRSMIRIKGDDPVNVENARLDILAALSQISTSDSLTIALAYDKWRESIEGIAAECGLESIECKAEGGKVHMNIKGKEMATRTAKHRLTDLSHGVCLKALELDAHQSKSIKARACPLHKELAKISTLCTKAHGKLSIDITSIGHGALISVEGTPKGVAQAYNLLLVALSAQFPGLFHLVPVPIWPNYDQLHLAEYMQLVGKEALQTVALGSEVAGVIPLISLDAANKCVVVTAPDTAAALKGKEELAKYWAGWFDRHACIAAPEWAWGMVIGAKGAKIKALKAAHGGDKGLQDINVDKDLSRIVLEGEPKFVASAALELEKRIAGAKPPQGKDTSSEQNMTVLEVPNHLIPYVIGKKGVEIRRIEAATKTKLDTTNSTHGGKTDRVTIKGDPVACQAAEAMVMEILSQHDEQYAPSPIEKAEQPVKSNKAVAGCGWSSERQSQVLGLNKQTVPVEEEEVDVNFEPVLEEEGEVSIAPVVEEAPVVVEEEEESMELQGKGWAEFLREPEVKPKHTPVAQPVKKEDKEVDVKISKSQKRRKNKKEEGHAVEASAPPAAAATPPPAQAQKPAVVTESGGRNQPKATAEPKATEPKSSESLAESALADHFGAGSERLMALLFASKPGDDTVAALAPPGLPVPVAALMTKQANDAAARYVPPAKRDGKKSVW